MNSKLFGRSISIGGLIVSISLAAPSYGTDGFEGAQTTNDVGNVAFTQKVLLPATGVVQVAKSGATTISADLLDRTSQIKDTRKQQEKVTEALIQEKLESSRLDDERKRAKKLFGNTLAEEASATTESKQLIPLESIELKPTPVESSLDVSIKKHTTVATEAAPAQDVDIEALKQEIRQEFKSELSGSTSAKAEDRESEISNVKKSGYIGALIGGAGYPELYNVEGNISSGVVVGGRIAPKVYLEGSFLYSRHYLNQDYWNTALGYWERINQFNIQMAAKYALMESRLMPTVGGALSYTRRTYSSPDPFSDFDENGSSAAFDVGLVVGLDFAVSHNFSIGADFRYMINLTASEESEFLSRQYRASGVQAIEESDYYLVGASIKLMF